MEEESEEKTEKLRNVQIDKMTELYRFAEFGRMSSGVFHDFTNHLNALSLNMAELENKIENTQISEMSKCVKRAMRSTKKLEDLVLATRKQLIRKENKTNFFLNKEIIYVIDILSHKAKQADIPISFSPQEEIEIFGEAIKFNQVVLNLISNAIEAYPDNNKNSKTIAVYLYKRKNYIIFKVADCGKGIPKENISKIFKSFFTTKIKEGAGLGLANTKHIVEKDFNGKINAKSSKEGKTVFTVKIPM